ncbi:MAG: transcription antitermination factor NusB [Syntrophales bacterium]|nr:transcription antitermination factor NusB [Syntrophales bacterium]
MGGFSYKPVTIQVGAEEQMRQRRKAREIALQVLYSLDVSDGNVKEAIDLFWKNFEAPKQVRAFSDILIEGAWNNRKQIDTLIGSYAENWSVGRMAKVDKSILRMAVYELLYCRDIPPKVAINEAIDLGKLFGSENSGSFINGVLDALYAKLRERDTAVGEGF